ncbi:MAG: GNAT family N-acetyltransferase [Ferruginibacter sp.]
MDFSGFSLVIINQYTIIKPFDCGDDDLNDFLFSKSVNYSNQLLATSYLLETDVETVAFFSIFNDKVKVEEKFFASKNAFKRFISNIVKYGKRHLNHFPAIKIGRLAVTKSYQKAGIGSTILDFVTNLALEQNKSCACKLISVDAYAQSLKFYIKRGFIFFDPSDEGEETRQMYFDLTPLVNSA